MWELSGGELTRTWASEEARRRADLPCDRAQLAAACQAQAPAVLEWPGEADTWWRVQITPLGGTSVLAAFMDITAHRAHLRSLRASEHLNGEILSRLQEGVVVVDMDARVVVVNDAAAALFGVAVQDIADRPVSGIPVDLLDDHGHLLSDEQQPLTRALLGEEVSDQVVRFVRRDGSLLWVEIHANPLRDEHGEQYGAVASYDDVTARVEQDRRTRHEADHDALTGLANRRALERTLEAALGRAAARSRAVGVVMLDLDGFKAINDTRGHAAGDSALREVAARLRRCVRERDLVARLGGDEFVVVLTDLDRVDAVADSVERVREALTPSFDDMELRAAIGVALYPSDGGTADDLLAHADRAMYVDKGARNGSLR
ncbi:PAS domain S-box-containing protein/diguanylate cyclase (GGDEF)-like protein [Solirubrobacter pauli]|uniref:PAS domain S-box-containing protein/diguanylate cyclase (GGDEF)-like protein n=2 Tax=Solirubrobacter pauli TaxID=166793 RepID=A0A660LEW2_9ACTN|nr:PAS domain S-box-containing protein/diguanylate cyclase (GGDEF)-like protein [Solirubrobacter pauli]